MSAVGRKLTLNLNKLRKKLTDVPADASQADQQEHYLHVPAGGPGDGNTGEGSQRSASLSSSPVQKSHSMCSINREEREAIGQDDIMKLTQEVKCFSDALALLKSLFTEPQESSEEVRVLAHERLGEVLNLLKTVLQSYQALNSTDVFSASGTLITKIKNYSYEREDAEEQRQLCDAIDQLALAFSSSVSEYLMGETVEEDETDVKTKSCDNLASVPGEMTEGEFKQGHLSADDVNLILVELEAGVDLALQRAKAWSKYAKDVISYIDRKSQFESEYAKNLTRLAQSMKQPLTEEGFLPLQSVYCTAMSQDIEYASTSQATCNLLQNQKFVEPMALRRAEHDKVRKFLKDIWSKEMKKMHDAVTNLKKAKSMYIQRHQEFDKARELAQKTEADMLNQSGGAALSKVDKRKRLEEDALHRAAEAETTYKACVAEANIRQDELAKVKGVVLTKLQEQIRLSDETMKRVTMDYFQLQIAVSAPVPVQHQTLCETSHDYEPGSQYAEFVRRIPVSAQRVQHEPFTFQPYQPEKQHGHRKPSNQSNGSGGSDHASQENSPQSAQRRHFKDRAAPFQAWAQGGLIPGSDTDSASSYRSGENPSPRSSPRSRAGRHYEHGDEDIEDHLNDSGLGHSVETLIGQGRKTVAGRVRDSDYHTVCSRLGGRRNTFGVDFGEQVKKTNTQVPPIVTLCLQEIENRGLDIRGIYRVSGVKSKVETLCQKFDNNPEGVDLGEENPNVISNVLKLYLRQLPEPLLSFRLYPEFIRVAKEDMSGNVDSATTVERLTALVQRLPKSNFKTSAILMHHLKKLASNVEFNQMSCNNLGIVFGPTLLRPKEGTASLTSLVDTPHQTRTVELLIVNAEEVFGPAADYQVTDIQPGNVSPDRLPSEDGSIDDNLDETPARSPVASGIESVFSEEPSPVDKESGHEFSLPGSASVGNHLSLSSDSEVTSDGGRVIPVQRVSTVSGAVRPSDPGSGARRLDVQRESTPPADSSHSVNIIIPIDSVQALREKMKRDLGVAPSPPPTDHPSVERPPLKSPSASAKMAFFYGDPEHSNSGKSWGSQFPEQKLSPRDSLRTSHSASQLVADKEAGADQPPRVTSLPADLTRGPGRPTGSRLSMPVPKPYTSTLVHPVEMRGDKPPVTTTTTSECAADNSAVQQAVVKGIVGGNATTTTAASTSQVNSDKQPVELTKAARLPTAKTSSYGFSGDGSNPVQLRRTPRPVLTTSYSLPLPGTGVRPGDVKAADRQGIPLPYSRPTELRENSKPASLTSSHNAQISGTGPISGTKPPVTTIAKFKLGEPAESADSDKDSVTSSAMAGTTVGVSAVPSAQPLCEDKIEYKIPVRYVVSDSRDSPPVEQVQKSESETIVIQPVKMSPRELETKYV